MVDIISDYYNNNIVSKRELEERKKMFTNAPSVRRFVPCNEDGSPELWEEEDIHFRLDRVELASNLDLQHPQLGNLYVTSKRVIWLSQQSNVAYDFDVPYITLHAVSRDVNTYPKSCIYCQLDEDMPDERYNAGDHEGSGDKDEDAIDGANQTEEEEEEEVMTEIFLVPEEERDLQAIFDALSHAALLNPDPEEDGDDEDGYDDFIYNLDEVQLGAEQAKALEHLESVFQFPVGDQDEGGDYEEGEEGEDYEEGDGEGNDHDDDQMDC